jgi:hemerythrin-like domain-containing protein
MPDAITTLKADHKKVERLFREFEKTTDRATKTRQSIVQSIVAELSVHTAIEEQVFYPMVRREVSERTDEVLTSLEEHHIVKWLLSELDAMDPKDDHFEPKVMVLIELVRQHVLEEEQELFPAVRATLHRRRLVEIDEDLEAARALVSSKPHPRLPDEPPLNVLTSVGAGAVERAVDAAKNMGGRILPS